MKITFDLFYSKNPCKPYQSTKNKEIFKNYLNGGKSLIEILKDANFPVVLGQNTSEDKIWLATQFLSDKTNRLFAIACCRAVWEFIPEGACQTAIEVAERYANGQATDEELATARFIALHTMGCTFDIALETAFEIVKVVTRDNSYPVNAITYNTVWNTARVATWNGLRDYNWSLKSLFDWDTFLNNTMNKQVKLLIETIETYGE